MAGEEDENPPDSKPIAGTEEGSSVQSEDAVMSFSEMETIDYHGSETMIKMLTVESLGTVRTEPQQQQLQPEEGSEQTEGEEPK